MRRGISNINRAALRAAALPQYEIRYGSRKGRRQSYQTEGLWEIRLDCMHDDGCARYRIKERRRRANRNLPGLRGRREPLHPVDVQLKRRARVIEQIAGNDAVGHATGDEAPTIRALVKVEPIADERPAGVQVSHYQKKSSSSIETASHTADTVVACATVTAWTTSENPGSITAQGKS